MGGRQNNYMTRKKCGEQADVGIQGGSPCGYQLSKVFGAAVMCSALGAWPRPKMAGRKGLPPVCGLTGLEG